MPKAKSREQNSLVLLKGTFIMILQINVIQNCAMQVIWNF